MAMPDHAHTTFFKSSERPWARGETEFGNRARVMGPELFEDQNQLCGELLTL
jgi:hypothetical protein